MKTIIAGGRDFNDREYLQHVLSIVNFQWPITEVVSGGAAGADDLGERWGYWKEIPVKIFPADWKKYQKAAGYIRNKQMADYADALVAFWDGRSKGTKNMIDLAIQKGLYIKVFYYEK